MTDYVSRSTTDVAALPHTVWSALVNPELASTYMFGSTVASDFQPGSPITFRGEYEGRSFEDHGEILEADEPRLLRYTHYSPLSGQPDVPESYHTLTFTLEESARGTRVTLTQDNNPSQGAADHSTANWERVLEALRVTAERLGG
ncbi:SRPBCC domain-containing protein [Georgenia yuyongxinii]|uniref:SRPBCC domain-containing protein n=1 Tax=Georgenia yuyongxinii TaxID=2589797 RepID=A0A5B8C3Y3_9MICO|nr:SRPBCC domain-containing protein [Georgenia yuyongxinii]QDC24998.1 SRPBCC domain-containing protein [Georgenia yuyongxinii]